MGCSLDDDVCEFCGKSYSATDIAIKNFCCKRQRYSHEANTQPGSGVVLYLEKNHHKDGFHWIYGGSRTGVTGRLVEQDNSAENPFDYYVEEVHQFMQIKDDE